MHAEAVWKREPKGESAYLLDNLERADEGCVEFGMVGIGADTLCTEEDEVTNLVIGRLGALGVGGFLHPSLGSHDGIGSELVQGLHLLEDELGLGVVGLGQGLEQEIGCGQASINEPEGFGAGGLVNGRVVGEFGDGEFVGPVLPGVRAVEAQELFDCLVGSFGLSVRFWMSRCGKVQ